MTRAIRHLGLILLTGALAWVVAASSAGAEQGSGDRPALAGVWQLNRDLSSPPGGGPGGGQMGPAGGRRRGGFGGGMGGGGGRGGGMGGRRGGGARDGRPAEDRMAQLRDAMRELLQPATRLTVVQQGDAVSFTDDQGHVRKFVVNGKKEKHQLQSATLDTKSQWKDGALVIEWETERGPKVVRTFRTPQSGQLIVETTVAGGGMGGDRPPARHVYEAVTTAQ